MSICSIEDCQNKVHGRGWCQMHLTRWRRHGDPLLVKKIIGNEEARFLARVNKTETCWLWTGSINNNGYPQFPTSDSTYAHRWAHTFYIREIPAGFQVDHLCRVRHCVNPDHLQAVTRATNIRRSNASHDGNGLCRNGHDVTDPKNVHHFKSGARTCRICLRISQRLADLRRRKAAA